jgi:hypothetical protein
MGGRGRGQGVSKKSVCLCVPVCAHAESKNEQGQRLGAIYKKENMMMINKNKKE